MSEAVQHNEWADAREPAGDLLQWLSRGGFALKLTGHPLFDKLAAEATCNAILEQ